MNQNLYTKITNYKLFGIAVFQKEEAYKETDFDNNEVVIVRPDYYKAEFE